MECGELNLPVEAAIDFFDMVAEDIERNTLEVCVGLDDDNGGVRRNKFINLN